MRLFIWQTLIFYLILDESGTFSENNTSQTITDNTLANTLYDRVKVLCWIMTCPKNHEKKAQYVKATWGKRCNKLIFMSSAEDKSLPSVALKVNEGRNNLWAKTKEAFKYVYDHHFDDYDWFMKADDDTYVIVENLRYMLYPITPDTPVFFGSKINSFTRQGYMDGGSGYVLSKEALRRFIEEAIPNGKLCRKDHRGAEDVEIGKCLAAVNVSAGGSRDFKHRTRFFPFTPGHRLLFGDIDKNFWLWSTIYYGETKCKEKDCCSDNAISFHYIDPATMFVLEYLIYHVKPFGIGYKPEISDLAPVQTIPRTEAEVY